MNYPFEEIEKKWQKYWEENKVFSVKEDEKYPKEKRAYVLDMFPYPSAQGLHVGHPEGYTATDIYSRYLRMNGYNVLHPMGFDSFGLPAENYAIQTGTHPAVTTKKNIDTFRRQIKRLGFCYDWDREISTSDPDYYKWTQWIFLKLFEKGLAYETEAPINFCPSCKTGLANEEVKDGCCERCGTVVEKKNVRQWVLKISEYADRLLKDLDLLDWPESVKNMQVNWIGRSEGATVFFKIENSDKNLEVFTTRCDTLFGATYMVVAPEHPYLKELTTKDRKKEVEAYVLKASKKTDIDRTDLSKEKTGVFTGSYAINPVNNKKIPIWVADYVLISYGTGAIMAVPAHDTRDWEFAKKFGLPIVQVLKSEDATVDIDKAAYTEDGSHINSAFLDGLNKEDAINKMLDYLTEHKIGHKKVNYKLRDWIFSRQRYWGEPIPIIHCEKCGLVPVPEKDLPLRLPDVKSYLPSGTGESPLVTIKEWVNCTCPKCNGKAKRETNTMPQWGGSCWYYIRYTDPNNDKCIADKKKQDYWLPVDLYVGGTEHAVLHLLYARFWHKVLYDLGVVSTPEPFKKLVNQGIITAYAYMKANKKLVPSDKVEARDGKFYFTETGEEVFQTIAKMSKSLKNVINPDDVIAQYGCDTMRLYEMFLGPLQVSKPWSTDGISGVSRFIEKVWKLANEREISDEEVPEALNKVLHKTIKKVTEDTSTLNFNTAISQLMIFINECSSYKCLYRDAWKTFTLLLSPYVPHLSEELWEKLGYKASVCNEDWPKYIEKLTLESVINLVVQVNGKVRARIETVKGLSEADAFKLSEENENVKRFILDKTIIKKIYIQDKIVNYVVK